MGGLVGFSVLDPSAPVTLFWALSGVWTSDRNCANNLKVRIWQSLASPCLVVLCAVSLLFSLLPLQTASSSRRGTPLIHPDTQQAPQQRWLST